VASSSSDPKHLNIGAKRAGRRSLAGRPGGRGGPCIALHKSLSNRICAMQQRIAAMRQISVIPLVYQRI
jgi:hypothetical protein